MNLKPEIRSARDYKSRRSSVTLSVDLSLSNGLQSGRGSILAELETRGWGYPGSIKA